MDASEIDRLIMLRGGPRDGYTTHPVVEDPLAKRAQEQTDDQRELQIRAEAVHVVQPDRTVMFLLGRLDKLRASDNR